MSDERHRWDEPTTTSERKALEAVRSLRTPPPAADARARAREAFLAAPPTRRRRSAPRRAVWGSVLIAAAATLALLFFGLQPAEPWVVVNPGPTGGAQRDGSQLELVAGEPLLPGPVALDAANEIELQWGDLKLRTRGDARFELPSPPGRWFGQERVLRLIEGEVYGSSGERSAGFELTLVTPEATARLTGTTFAVFRTDEATCFCLYRGGLAVTPTGEGEEIALPVGNRIFVFRDGRPPAIESLDAGEQMKLRMIDDAAVAQSISDTGS